MANFNIPVGMKCTEKEFNSSFIGGKSLRLLLEQEGYDFSELRFTQPFIVNFYKKIGDKIGTTTTPFSYAGRNVIQYWDEELFYALCCQREYTAITVGEFFTTADKSIFQCTGIDKDWLKVGIKSPKQMVFNISSVHKSTYEELSDFYDLKRNRAERFAEAKQAVNNIFNGKAKAEEPVKPEPIAAPKLILTSDFEKPMDINEAMHHIKTTGMLPPIDKTHIKQVFTMSAQQLFDAMIAGKDVFYGIMDEGRCECTAKKIKMISPKSVYLEAGHEHSAQPLNCFFESMEKFHLHALQKLAETKK